MRSPVLFLKRAIFRKKPSIPEYKGELRFERMSGSNNKVLSGKYFTGKFEYGYDGFLVFDSNQKIVGYYWYNLNQPSIINIPKIPKDSPWIFNMFVYEEHRGHGYQKEMLKHFEVMFSSYKWLYADIRLDNTPSIKSFLKLGYGEIGIYYIVVMGIRRIRSLNFKFGYWNRKKKHKYKF